MSIMPDELENPERSLDLENRDERRPRRPRLGPVPVLAQAAEPSAEEQLAALRTRIASARRLKVDRGALHCRDCWERGRDAALDLIEGK